MIPFDISEFQPRSWAILSRSFKAERVAGTYLFYGKEGYGGWATAVSLAALLNCEKPQEKSADIVLPCGECINCRKIYNLNFENMFFALPLPPPKKEEDPIDLSNEILDEKRKEPFKIISFNANMNIPISVAREIKKSLSRKADQGVTRIVIFYKMELMRTSSADALLKMIEEPQPNTVIILTSSRPEALLPTIHSRAQKIKLDSAYPGILEKYLINKYELTEKKARLISRISEDSPGKAVEMLDHDHESETSERAVGFYLFKSLVQQESFDLAGHINEMVNCRDLSEAVKLLTLWQSLIRDCSVYAIDGDEEQLINVDFSAEIINLSSFFSQPQTALEMAELIKITLADLRRNVHIQGALTAVALKLKNNLRIER